MNEYMNIFSVSVTSDLNDKLHKVYAGIHCPTTILCILSAILDGYWVNAGTCILSVMHSDRPAFIFNFRNCSSHSPLSGPSETLKRSPTTGQEGPTKIDQKLLTDLRWWIHKARKTNGRPIVPPVANLVIMSDALSTGWGATCQNMSIGGS